MAGAKPKYQCQVKVYAESGTRLETQGTREFGLRAIYVSMSEIERQEARAVLDAIDAKEKENG